MGIQTKIKKPQKIKIADESSEEKSITKKGRVRPRVEKLIEKVLRENSSTWKELAKR